MDSHRSGRAHSSKEKPVNLVKATKSARLPSSVRECCCRLVKATNTAKSTTSTSLGRPPCGPRLVKATRTVNDEESLIGDENTQSDNTNSFRGLDHKMNEKSSLRRMFTVAASSQGQMQKSSSKQENKVVDNKRCSRLPPRGGMVQRGISRGKTALVKGTKTAIIPLGEQQSSLILNNAESTSQCAHVFDPASDEEQSPQSWQEIAMRLPLPQKDNDVMSSYSDKSQAYMSEIRRPSLVKVHSVEKILAAEAKEERLAKPCCASAALREMMLRSRKGSSSVVKESLAKKPQSSSEYVDRHRQSRSELSGKQLTKDGKIIDVHAGTQRLYGLEVVGNLFRVLLDGKELWTAHDEKNNEKIY